MTEEFSLMDVKVGDTLLIRRGFRLRRYGFDEVSEAKAIERRPVVKVTRELIHVDFGVHEKARFERADGVERTGPRHIGPTDRAFTETTYKEFLRRQEAKAELAERTRRPAWMRDLSADQMERILRILNEADQDA